MCEPALQKRFHDGMDIFWCWQSNLYFIRAFEWQTTHCFMWNTRNWWHVELLLSIFFGLMVNFGLCFFYVFGLRYHPNVFSVRPDMSHIVLGLSFLWVLFGALKYLVTFYIFLTSTWRLYSKFITTGWSHCKSQFLPVLPDLAICSKFGYSISQIVTKIWVWL